MDSILNKTAKNSDIKIFVSCRIDTPSAVICNQIYIPVACGSIYAKNPNSQFVRDDKGDNISQKRKSFCEFTVQYWGWKNVIADYYGLCHYRRYLTFSKKRFRANVQNQVMEGLLDNHNIAKYDLLNEKRMRKIIENYDVVANEAADVDYIPTPLGCQHSVYDHWVAHDGVFIDKRVLPLLVETIHRLAPEYDQAAKEYLAGKWHRGYNCYVMKKSLFYQMCEFQFSILFDLEKQLDKNGLANKYERTIGYMGEILYGIFIYYLQKQGVYRIKELQLVYFEQTVVPDGMIQLMLDRLLFSIKFRFENIGYILLPKGSKRRNFVKKIYFSLVKR